MMAVTRARGVRSGLLGPAWVLLLIVLCSAFGNYAKASPPVPDGSLIVRLGQGSIKNILVFVWDHRCKDCTRVFRDVVEPLNSDIDAGKLTVLLLQVLPPNAEADAANAAALAMVPPDRYSSLVLDWLSSTIGMAEPMEKRIGDALLKHWSREPEVIATALRDRSRYDGTLLKLRIMTSKVEQTLPWRNRVTPWLALNGVALVTVGGKQVTAASIRQQLLP